MLPGAETGRGIGIERIGHRFTCVVNCVVMRGRECCHARTARVVHAGDAGPVGKMKTAYTGGTHFEGDTFA